MTSAFWTLERVGDALAGLLSGARPADARWLTGISTNTRAITPGDCFVALAGDRFDAHDFLPEAVAKGAAAVVVSRAQSAAKLGVPAFVVSDTLRALGALAAHRRRAWGGTVVGVAGSNGKTTTKELIRAALGGVLDVHATVGNLNNLIGVPLTLLAVPDGAEVAVVEMGMNVPGEMERLQSIVAPDLAVVTCVAEEHLEGLGSLEVVLREESVVFQGACVGVAPATQPEIAAAAKGHSTRVVTAGLDDGDLRADRWGLGPDGLGWLEVQGVSMRPPVRGAHNLRNAMLALAAARECGVSMEDAGRGLATTTLPGMRLAVAPLGRATLINDAYNASPASMRAALELLAGLDPTRQRVAVLGTMRELGAHAARLHAEVARDAAGAPLDLVAAIGEMADALAPLAATDRRIIVAPDLEALWPQLEPRLARDAIILLKASRGVKLERLVPHLTAWADR